MTLKYLYVSGAIGDVRSRCLHCVQRNGQDIAVATCAFSQRTRTKPLNNGSDYRVPRLVLDLSFPLYMYIFNSLIPNQAYISLCSARGVFVLRLSRLLTFPSAKFRTVLREISDDIPYNHEIVIRTHASRDFMKLHTIDCRLVVNGHLISSIESYRPPT